MNKKFREGVKAACHHFGGFVVVCLIGLSLQYPARAQGDSSQIQYVGSSTIGELIEDVRKVYPGKIQFVIQTESESFGGETACLKGTADIGGVARNLNLQLFHKDVFSTLIGKDAIALIVHPKMSIQSLSILELAGIYEGRIKNWKELGGPDLSIRPMMVGPGSATRNIFRGVTLKEKDFSGVETIQPDAQIISKVAQTPGAIGAISRSFLVDVKKVKIVLVNGEEPTAANLNYPITRPLYLCTPGRPKGNVKEFIHWILSDAGQAVVMQRFVGARVLTTVQPKPKPKEQPMGYLIVYTEARPVQESGLFYYPHLPYVILDEKGDQIRTVQNSRSLYDDQPTKVSLPEGRYVIRAESHQKTKPEVVVIIKAGQVTTIHIEAIQKLLEEKRNGFLKTGSEKIRFNSDIRTRLENDFNRDAVNDIRTRGRFRLRLGTNIDVNEDFQVGIRLATGTLTDPNSPHQTFTGAFDHANFAVDRAYLQWNPRFLSPLTLWVGKFVHPFVTPVVFPELVWDQDVQPEGGAIGFAFKDLGLIKKLNVVNGSYILLEQDPGVEAWMNASQAAASFQLSNKLELTAASGFYYYSNVNAGAPGANAIVRNDNAGNTATDTDGDGVADSFVADFRIADNFVNLTYTGLPMPISFQGQYFHNFGKNATRDDGYAFGVAYGQLKEQWNWRAYYQYQLVGQDAIFSPFSQDDFLRQTNFKGHAGGVAVAVYKNVDLHAWTLIDQRESAGGGKQQVRSRLDLNVRF